MHASRIAKNFIKTLIPNTILTYRLPIQARNSVLLTFDDGPEYDITPKILDILAAYNARAVFFVVGKKINDSPELLDLIVSRGHIIGNHTYSHPNRIMTSATEYQEEILKCAEMIQQRTGQGPYLIRPPLGISYATLRVSRRLKVKTILWSIEGGEAGVHKEESAAAIGDRLNKTLRARDILLLHDENPKALAILDIILPDMKKRGLDLYNGISTLCPPN